MAKIVFQGYGCTGGLGDALIDLKVLYAIKQLYPNDELVYYYPETALPLFSKIAFIDTIINSCQISIEKIRELNPDVIIFTRRKGSFFRYLKTLHFKKVIVLPHFVSFVSKGLITPFPFFRGKKHFSDIHLKLVRAINPKHYDANIDKIDFSKVKDFLPTNETLSQAFFQSVNFAYKKVVAINAFSGYSESVAATNFFIKDWVNLAYELGKIYPEFLFVLLNFKQNLIQLHINETPNVRVFVNDDDLASLVSISSKFDFFITQVTGNSHLCDILQIPSLILVRKDGATYRMRGGLNKAACELFIVKAGWQKNYPQVLKTFTQKAKEKLENLKHN